MCFNKWRVLCKAINGASDSRLKGAVFENKIKIFTIKAIEDMQSNMLLEVSWKM